MIDIIENLKCELHDSGIEWNPLYEKGIKIKPFYFGIYKTVYKPGFKTAEKLYLNRLQKLINYLNTFEDGNAKARQTMIKISHYHNSFDSTVDFNSEAFRIKCRFIIKSLISLTSSKIKATKNKLVDNPLINEQDKKFLLKLSYQLNPCNYIYPFLTHFYFVSDEGITTLLINDKRKNQVRRLDKIVSLKRFIADFEVPRGESINSLSYRYLIYEDNPGSNCNQSLVYIGIKYGNNMGLGVKHLHTKKNLNEWDKDVVFSHWRM